MTYHSRSSQQKIEQRFKENTESMSSRVIAKKKNTTIIRVPEGKKREKRAESLFKDITVNIPNLGKDVDTEVHGTNRPP